MWIHDILIRVINILFHLVLLSLAEPLFFFEFAGKLEDSEHVRKMDAMDERLRNLFSNLTNEQKQMVQEFLITHNFETELKNQSQKSINAKQERDKYNQDLIYKSIYITFAILLLLLLLSFIAWQYQLKFDWKTLFFENIVVLIGIFLYEAYFYYNVAARYQSSSNEEDLNNYMNLTWNLFSSSKTSD